MKNKNNHIDIYKHLTQEELLDYANGVLSNDEMYRLELHLTECELCSDAIEGIGLLKKPEDVLSTIHENVLPQPKKNNVNYLAIAASVALVSVFGLSYFLFNNSSKNQNIADNTPIEQKEIAKKAKSIAKDGHELIQPTENRIITEEPIVESSNTTEFEKPADIAPAQSAKQKIIIAEKEEEAEPIINLVAGSALSNESDLAISTPSEKALDETAKEQEIVQAAPMAAQSARKAVSKPTALLKDQKEPIPQGGMSALKVFIEQNLKYPQEAIDTKTKGTVVLEVTISANGAIKNIIIIKSVGHGCDAEAMRLITTGPNWLPAVENGVAIEEKRQVKIKFKN